MRSISLLSELSMEFHRCAQCLMCGGDAARVEETWRSREQPSPGPAAPRRRKCSPNHCPYTLKAMQGWRWKSTRLGSSCYCRSWKSYCTCEGLVEVKGIRGFGGQSRGRWSALSLHSHFVTGIFAVKSCLSMDPCVLRIESDSIRCIVFKRSQTSSG